jgi:hypothetical protein
MVCDGGTLWVQWGTSPKSNGTGVLPNVAAGNFSGSDALGGNAILEEEGSLAYIGG